VEAGAEYYSDEYAIFDSEGRVHPYWRLPNVRELQSLIDYGNYNPALPTGHPFTNVQSVGWYWSSTTYAYFPWYAWLVYFHDGLLNGDVEGNGYYGAWCVRGGQ
jgi:hypothetical protein